MFKACDQTQQSGLAAAGRTKQREKLVLGNVDVDLLQGGDGVFTCTEHLGDVSYFNHVWRDSL